MKVKKMALIGILGALSAVLMIFIHFPLPFMPPFMDFDFASVPEMIGGFALGPSAAVMIIAIKILIKLCLIGTSTVFTGEVQNFILSLAYVLPAVYVYQRNKSKKSAIQGMMLGTVICTIVSVFSNIYFIIPFYAKLYANMTFEAIIGMCAAINPMVNSAFTLAIFGIIPFNIIKNGITSIVTVILYKKISSMVKSFMR